ncbi:hypothetical protein ABID99_004933 [Mucilaginibacter sp. OAE612]
MIVKKKGIPNLIMITDQNVNYITIISKSEYYITENYSTFDVFLFPYVILTSNDNKIGSKWLS